MDQNKLTGDCVWANPSRQKTGMGQTEQAQFRYWPDGEALPKICSATHVRLVTTCLGPQGFILGGNLKDQVMDLNHNKIDNN